MSPRARTSVATAVVLALLVACALWLWPGFLRGQEPREDDAQTAAAALGHGLLRGDPETMRQLAPEDGTLRTLLSPEAAAAIFGADARVSLRRTGKEDDREATFDLTIHTKTGEQKLALELTKPLGPKGPWTPKAVDFPQVTVSTGSATPPPLNKPLPLSVNGTALTFTLRATHERMRTFPGALEFVDTRKNTPTVVGATPRLLTEGMDEVLLSVEPGDTFAAEARRALDAYLASCRVSPPPSSSACPFVPGPVGVGASQRRQLVYSAPVLKGSAAPDAAEPSQLFSTLGIKDHLEGTVASSWEELVGGTWRKAKGSAEFDLRGGFAADGDKIVFVPEGDYGGSAYFRGEANTDRGSAAKAETP